MQQDIRRMLLGSLGGTPPTGIGLSCIWLDFALSDKIHKKLGVWEPIERVMCNLMEGHASGGSKEPERAADRWIMKRIWRLMN